ncbi:type II secretion system secretin GspD [Teredinibacter sp. KSP-S5-2]|nr:type II secretion system secretin GspD [Teredinibacter sp. KSP-S5-2]WNO08980.1 type II secretion system secretin GspD [Teredinibacter sp. KSP-S5-2]
MFKHSSIFMGLIFMVAVAGSLPSNNSYAAEQTWTINFKDSDIQEVIKFVADVTGKTIIIDPRVKGRVKVISNKALNEHELYELFRTVLEVHDFTVVEVGDVVRVIPLKDARSAPLPVVDNKSKEKAEGYVTHVIQLKNIAAAKVLPVLRPLVPQHSHLAAYSPSNAIVISDTAENIARMQEVIEKIDTAALPVTEVIELKYAHAPDVVQMLDKLQSQEAKTGPEGSRLKLVADKRNNTILVSGEDVHRENVKRLVRRMDKPQRQTGNVRVIYLEYAKAKEVATVLTKVVQNMTKMTPGDDKNKQGATVEADEDTNSLLITASGEVLDSLLAVVDRLDIRRAQVLVEAIIVELTLGKNDELGIEWMFSNSKEGVFGSSIRSGTPGIGSALLGSDTDNDDTVVADLAAGLVKKTGQIFGVAGTAGDEKFIAVLNALKQNDKANILSTPTLLTMDNHEATISVGQNVPFVTGSFSNTGGSGNVSNPFQTIQREDVGITLTVTPHVNEGDKVLLDIAQEVSSITPSEQASDIITNKKDIKTQVLASDGEVIVLGGLIEDKVTETETKVPILGSIPLLGNLFKSQGAAHQKQNLMVFLKATIIRDDETLYGATAEKYKLIRDEQIGRREKGLFLMKDSVLPVLPELDAMRPRDTEVAAKKEDKKAVTPQDLYNSVSDGSEEE